MKRIEKLLSSEYCDFQDAVLIESPFAETSRCGRGSSQVQIGLTTSKLILASENIQDVNDVNVFYTVGLDPSIENFELISIYPIDCVNLSIFHRRKRHTLKAYFCNKRVKYYELGGGPDKYKSTWKHWCEKVKFFNPTNSSDSVSTGSFRMLKLVSTNVIKRESGRNQIWCKYDSSPPDTMYGIPHKKLRTNKRTKSETMLTGDRETNTRPIGKNCVNSNNLKILHPPPQKPRSVQVNRFGSGIPENCTVGLFLDTMYEENNKKKQMKATVMEELAESTVNVWESSTNRHIIENSCGDGRQYHCVKQYAICPQPFFFHGLGLWNISSGESHCNQAKHVVSEVCLKKARSYPSLVGTSASCETVQCVNLYKRFIDKKYATYFWTPERELDLLNCLNKKNKCQRKNGKNCLNYEYSGKPAKALQIKVQLSVWDFDKLVLAEQLTLIDKNLFIKIPIKEFDILVEKRTSKYTPHIKELITFSYRISCLVATEVLKEKSQKNRAHTIIRFIGIADKCNNLNNFHSCRSILAGLQSPSIYRLHNTWTYLRHHHANRFYLFERLCCLYQDTRLLLYQKTFHKATFQPPFLPFIGDLIGRLLNVVPPLLDYILSASLTIDGKPKKQWSRDTPGLTISNASKRANSRGDYEESITSNMTPVGCTSESHISSDSTVQNSIHILRYITSSPSLSVNSQGGIEESFVYHAPQLATSVTSSLYSSSNIELGLDAWRTQHNKIKDEMVVIAKDLYHYFKPKLTIEDIKRLRLNEVKHLLIRYQQASKHYGFKENQIAREFLLKSKYVDEKGNFTKSCKIEKHKVSETIKTSKS